MRKHEDFIIELLADIILMPLTLLAVMLNIGFALLISHLTGINVNTCLIIVLFMELHDIQRKQGRRK
jgi:hypothetical protein